MEQMLICLSIALIAGLLMSRLAKAVNLPAVTSYLVAGLLLGPFVLGRLGLSGLGICCSPRCCPWRPLLPWAPLPQPRPRLPP